jgi:hypothetical protein
MFGTTNKPGLASTAALGLVDDPAIRNAALEAAPPVAKLGLNVGRRFAKRRAMRRVDQISEAITTVTSLIAAYAPILIGQLGIVEQPKPRRTAPLMAGGALVGAGVVYFLEPNQGHRHRRRVQRLIAHRQRLIPR